MTSALFDDDEIVGIADIIRPPRPPDTRLAFSRRTKLPDGPKRGEYLRPESEPAQLHFIRALDNAKYSRFVNVAPSQRGKTTISIIIPWMHCIVELRQDVGYIMPNLDKLQQNWSGKIRPALVNSGFREWLPGHGPGSKEGRPAALTMTDPTTGNQCVTYFMAAGKGGSETALSSVSPAHLAIDEVDDFEDAGQVELALRRLQAWEGSGQDCAILASTVNARGGRDSHPILDFYNRKDATRCKIAHKCPKCGYFQVIRWEQFDLAVAGIRCSNAKCGALWSEDERHEALENSELCYGDRIEKGLIVPCDWPCEYFSLLTTGFDYHMGLLSRVPAQFTTALDAEKLGDYSLMENFKQKWLCEPYTIPVDHDTITDRMLAFRSAAANYGRGAIPKDAAKAVIGIDVQGDRCYWVVVASGLDDRRWIVDYGEWFWAGKDEKTGRPVEPTDIDRHAVLDRILVMAREGWPTESGAIMKATCIVVDIGYNPGGSIGRWCHNKAGVMAVRGDHEDRFTAELIDGTKRTTRFSRDGSSREMDFGFYEVRKQSTVALDQPIYWWYVKTQSMREHVSGRLRIPVDTHGSMMLPHGVPEKDYLIQHLSAWGVVRDQDTKITKWVQLHRRDDYLDATCYAMAALTAGVPQRQAGKVGTVKAKE